MNDLKLTEEHDLEIINGDFALLNNNANVAKQSLKINLLFFKEEWFLDSEHGVPYFQEIFGKTSNTFLADSIIKEIAENSYNIESIDDFQSSLGSDRVYSIDILSGTTLDGEIISITNLQI